MIIFFWFIIVLHTTISQDINDQYSLSDCKHLILPVRCQCYHSGHESQLRCLKSGLHSLPKLPNNMRWNALDFSSNYITSVDSYVFGDIYVEKLCLNSNYIRRIEPTAFHQIRNLKELFINHNQLKELHPQALASPGDTLEIFDLSENPLQYLDIGQILLNLPLLKKLHLRSCHLNDTSIYTLLKLSQNTTNEYNYTVLGRGHFALEFLDLSHNNLTTICHHLFDGLYNLIELDLSHNLIRLVDNNFLRTFLQIKILNLAHNSLQYVPKLSSRTLQVLNFSSNNIHHLSDYFAASLHMIRVIDFDYNIHLTNTSLHALCFLNILTLEKLTFRSNNLISLHTFNELLCRLANVTNKINVIDINHNVNLKCNCTLVQFQRFLNNFKELTCTQQGQDRYYISNSRNWFADCNEDICLSDDHHTQTNRCSWADAERAVYEGTCEAKLKATEKRRKSKIVVTMATTPLNHTHSFDNVTENRSLIDAENSTISQLGNDSISNRINFCVFIISSFVFLLL